MKLSAKEGEVYNKMKQKNKALTKIISLMTAVLIVASTSIIASAAEVEQGEQVNSATDTETKKKVLPRKGSKVKAVEDYRTHKVGSVEFQFPALGEVSEDNSGKGYTGMEFTYKDPYDHVKVNLLVYDQSILSLITTISYNRQLMLEKLLFGSEENEEVAFIMDNEDFYGMEYQRKEDEKVAYVTYLESNDKVILLTITADPYGMAAAKEYNEKIYSSLKTGKPDTRTILKNPERSKIKAQQQYKTLTMGDIQLQVPASSEVITDVSKGKGWITLDVEFTRFENIVSDVENIKRKQKLSAFRHPDTNIFVIVFVEENGGMVPEKLSDRKLMVSDICDWYTSNEMGFYPDNLEIDHFDNIADFPGYQCYYEKDGTYTYQCRLYGKDHSVSITVSTDEEGKEAAEEYYQKIIPSIKNLNPTEVIIKKN